MLQRTLINHKRFDYGKYIQLRYVENDRTGAVGVDCWGLVRLIYQQELGIDLPLYSEVSTSNLLEVLRTMNTASTQVNKPWIELGDGGRACCFDLVAMTVASGRRIGHVGLMIDANNMIHADRGVGVVIQEVTHPLICNRIVQYYRYRK